MKKLSQTLFIILLFSACHPKNSAPGLKAYQKKQDTKTEAPAAKSEFNIELLWRADGDKFSNPESEFYYWIGYDNHVSFVPGDTPTVQIPNWDLQILKDTVEFKKTKKLYERKAAPHRYPFNDSLKVRVKQTGFACDDTDQHEVTVETEKSRSVLPALAKVAVFANYTKARKEIYVISYHQCLDPDLKIYRLTEQK